MTQFLHRLRPTFIITRAVVPFLFEVVMLAALARAADILIVDQDYFERHERPFHWLVEHITREEWKLGVAAAIAATCMAIGLCCAFVRRERLLEISYVCRVAGWALSFCMWTLLGVTFWSGNPGNLISCNALVLGVLSFCVMITGPVIPEDRIDE